ncbi:MAG TPA: protein kinase [Pirellulales bacterium]|nr:protein kinase [Pirellulales bacterium]
MRPDCPSEPDLLAFHLGTLADSDVDRVAEHLEVCADCEAAVQRLDTAEVDPLVAALRKNPPTASIFDGQHARLRRGAREEPEDAVLPSLPGYEILGVFGRGGMGIVYKARQVRLNRLIALKRLRTASEKEVARSRVEAEALGRLQHPLIVQIHEVIEHEGRVYLALEFVEGGSLQARLTGKPQPCEAAAKLIELVARGVHHAHVNGIVHRDLKPANILLARRAQEAEWRALDQAGRTAAYGLPKIGDFGIAKWLSDDSGQTERGDVLGTATYMAPEQAAGNSAKIGPATDVYSMGVILYEMLTGRVPLQGTSTLETLALVRNEEPVSPRRLQPHIPRDLETICLKCLEKDTSARYRTADDLADDLGRFLSHEPIRARPITFWEYGWKWARRRPAVASLSAALVLLGLVSFVAIGWQWRRAESQAAAEFASRIRAEENERKIERLSASMMLDRAAALCQTGDVDLGLLWMVEALDASLRAEDEQLARVARLDLAGWAPFLLRERARCSDGGGVTVAAFHPQGDVVVGAGLDGKARFWNVSNGAAAAEPLVHDGPVHTVAYRADGRIVATGASNAAGRGEARLWNVETGRPLWSPLLLEGPVSQIAFCDAGEKFITVSPEETRLWNVADGAPAGAPMKHEPMFFDQAGQLRPMTAAVSPDGRLIATGGSDLRVRLWNAATAEPVGEPLLATHSVMALAFSADSKMVLAGAIDGGVRMWEATTGRRRGESLKMRGLVYVVAFSPDGQLAAAAGAVGDPHLEPAGEVQLCQVETGQNLGPNLAHPRPVHALAFSPGGRLLVTGCEDGQARFFLTSTSEQVGKPLPHEGPLRAVAFNLAGTTVATAAGQGNRAVRFWHAPPEYRFGRPFVLPGELVSVGFDGPSLLAMMSGAPGRRWLLDEDASNRPFGFISPPTVTALPAVATDGQTDHPQAGREPQVDSPDRLFRIEIGNDRIARLHDAATGKAFGPPLGSEEICSVAFNSDGSRLAAGAFDGRVAVWESWPLLEGTAERVRLSIELLVGRELVAQEKVRDLDDVGVQFRRQRLEALGGTVIPAGN